MMHMYGPEMGWGWMFLNGLLWLVIIVLVVILTVWARGRITPGTRGTTITQETPLDILKKRYARGEIDKEEFDQKKKDLME